MKSHVSRSPRIVGKISVLIPVYNEEDNVVSLSDEIMSILSGYADFEIVFINDGSKDNSLQLIQDLSNKNGKVYFISFSRNFGHQNALRAGFDHCTGDIVITLDGDHQHPPGLIPEMIDKWIEGYDVVFTTRKEGGEVSLVKRYTSSFFYWLIGKIADVDLKKGAADFRLFDEKVVHAVRGLKERDVFYRGLVAWLGFRQCEVAYTPERRRGGVSKYTYRKMLRLAVDGISSFSFLPLRLAAVTGFLIAMVSFTYVFYAIMIKLFSDQAVSGWVSLMAGVYFLGGVQLIFLGLFGEYVGRIFMEVKGRPNYLVSAAKLPGEDK
ncbi:glycosyltransferase family 2 protein [Desulfogranum mediterraneum]|uniref:glycosyltransferase family 2 protein n=1 Tax=Desulfogranum mediterraneum TaxID=160661 RepID=UPI00041ED499|nr:glycosyltransferase family 2 protein [Desulfogranum mediterraneum]